MPETTYTCSVCQAKVPVALEQVHVLTHKQRGETVPDPVSRRPVDIFLFLAICIVLGVIGALFVLKLM